MLMIYQAYLLLLVLVLATKYWMNEIIHTYLSWYLIYVPLFLTAVSDSSILRQVS